MCTRTFPCFPHKGTLLTTASPGRFPQSHGSVVSSLSLPHTLSKMGLICAEQPSYPLRPKEKLGYPWKLPGSHGPQCLILSRRHGQQPDIDCLPYLALRRRRLWSQTQSYLALGQMPSLQTRGADAKNLRDKLHGPQALAVWLWGSTHPTPFLGGSLPCKTGCFFGFESVR